ncbi:cytochrome p450 [Trifolium pratense]|uniref:Cytochrome p450 n=1 Tax=Trifolium pratense TaxID=57577 RepID=A0A2K3MKF7_TRIPR|nr:cytochrome p450 [Trifolium pratense]
MWTKLDALYMTKSLVQKQCLKERLFFFRIVENKHVVEQLSEFNKIIDDLANIDVNLEDEDKAFHLLCVLPKSLENLKDALLYGKEDRSEIEGKVEEKGRNMGPSLGQRVIVVARSNVSIVKNRVTSRRTTLREGAVVVRRLMLSLMRRKAMKCGQVENRWSLSRGLLDASITCVLRKEYFEALELVEGGVCSSWRWKSL